MKIRPHDQYNATFYGLDDRYRRLNNGRRVILMNAEVMREQKLNAGNVVDIMSHHGEQIRVAKNFCIVTCNIPRGSLARYFPATNVLVPFDQCASGSQMPA